MRTYLDRFFLFQRTPELRGWRRGVFWLWNWGCVLLSAAAITLMTLLLANGEYPYVIIQGYFHKPVILLLNLLPVLLAVVLVYLLTSRAWIAYLAPAAVFVAAAAGNYYKLKFRDDPFLISDIPNIGTAMTVAGRYDITAGRRIWLCVAGIALGTLLLFLLVRGRVGRRVRIAGAALTLLCALPTGWLMADKDIFSATNDDVEIGSWTPTMNFITRGFVYPFLHSAVNAVDTKPEGYHRDEAEAVLAGFTDADIPEDRKVNILVLQLEAFSDLSAMGVEGIDPGVYEIYHRIRSESYHGTLVTNSFAAGTQITERCFATGLSDLYNFRRDTNSYLWYLRGQGYHVTGSHPCVRTNYNRYNVNRWLGAEEYFFLEDHYAGLTGGGIAHDNILIPEILRLYEEDAASGAPVCSFNVTYQGHGPYGTTWLDYGSGYWDLPGRSDDAWYILNNYLGSIQNTSQYLWDMLETLRDDETPVVVVLYGDHKPWLGDSNSVYTELGVNLDVSTQDGFYHYYGTEYLIWANDAAREATGCDFTGEGETVSATFLMNELFSLLGWEGSAYMQYADTVMAALPVVSSHDFYAADGEIVRGDALTREQADLVRQFRCVQYYYRNTFFYRELLTQ